MPAALKESSLVALRVIPTMTTAGIIAIPSSASRVYSFVKEWRRQVDLGDKDLVLIPKKFQTILKLH